MSKKDVEWFYCTECSQYIETREKAIADHLQFGHTIKRRTPLSERLIHTSSGKAIHKFMVDGNQWFVAFKLLNFNADKSTPYYKGVGWKFNATIGLSGELQQIVDELNHLNPYQKFTVKELRSLVRNNIRKGIYEERGVNGAQILLCLSTDVKLVAINETSFWVSITRSQLRRLIRDTPDSLREAYAIAEKTEM